MGTTSRRLRVLLLSRHAPDARALGGVEIHVADLAAFLPADVEPFAAHLRAGRLVVEAMRPVRRELATLPASDLAVSLETALLALDVDVLHVHSPQIGADDIARAMRRAGAPTVVTLHDTMLTTMDAATLLSEVDALVAPSRFIRDTLARPYPGIAERTRLLRWAVPPQRPAAGSTGGPLRVAVVGVLARTKGAEQLPALMRACGHLGVEWHLFGATEGRSLRAIRAASRHVSAHGSYEREELGSLLDAAAIDVALLPSTVPESFGMTLSECLAATVPVVASDIGAFAERVREEACGWTFDVQRPASLANVLESIADRREIAEVKSRLAARAPHTRQQMGAEHTELYAEVVDSSHTEAPTDRRAAARARFSAAPSTGYPALRRLWLSVRHSRSYRELPLRRLLPEALRAVVERHAATLLDRLSR